MSPILDINEVTQHYRILGLNLNSSLKEVRSSRNKLIQKFHPDKHPDGWNIDDVALEDRVHLVQTSYNFIVKNFSLIQEQFSDLIESPLTNKSSASTKSTKSHWVYSEIQSYKK